MDASVLINFLRIDRMDLIARHSHDFIVTDHVAAEISDRYPEQRKRFAEAIDAVSQTSVVSPEEMSLFESLSASGRLGAGECSAVAVHRRHVLAIDDRLAATQARRVDQALRLLTTQNLMVSMIEEGLLDVAEADGIKDDWASRHRFLLKLNSFREV